MAKYYRVRTQEQWEWLMEYFEKQGKEIKWCDSGDLPTDFNFYHVNRGDTVVEKNDKEELYYSSLTHYQQDENVHSFIEVSDLMEDEKMENYITIKGEDLLKIKNEDNRQSFYAYIDDLFIPANYFKELHIPKSLLYPKVKFTEEEKREFDDIKKHVTALYNAMVLIFEHRDECINLNNKLFYSAPPKYLNDVQRDFARAWTDPSLIDVIPEKKYWVKCYPTDDCYFYKYDGKILAGMPRVHLERFHFTAKEITDYHLDGNTFEKVEVGDAKEN